MTVTVNFEVSDDFTSLININFTPVNLKVETIKGLLEAGADAIEEQLQMYGEGLDLVNLAKIIVAAENKKGT
jgi:hypothetical protein